MPFSKNIEIVTKVICNLNRIQIFIPAQSTKELAQV